MSIPNKIILTYKNLDLVPEYVFTNLKKLNPDKEVLFFSDDDVKSFLLKEYDSSYVDFFNSTRLGCTKGDLFRYCYLFKYGGYYSDIDLKHLEPMRSYISESAELFTVHAAVGPKIFQAFLYAKSEHPVIKNCIDDLMNPESAKDYYYRTTDDMHKNITTYLELNNNQITPGIYKIKDSKQVVQIGQEVCINSSPLNGPLHSFACLFGNRIIAMSRYETYKTERGFKST